MKHQFKDHSEKIHKVDLLYGFQVMDYDHSSVRVINPPEEWLKEPWYKRIWIIQRPGLSLMVFSVVGYLIATGFNPDWELILEIIKQILEGIEVY